MRSHCLLAATVEMKEEQADDKEEERKTGPTSDKKSLLEMRLGMSLKDFSDSDSDAGKPVARGSKAKPSQAHPSQVRPASLVAINIHFLTDRAGRTPVLIKICCAK